MRGFLNKIKLKWKIFAFLLGFCVLLLVILWLFQIVFLGNFYRHIRINETRDAVAVIIDSFGDEDFHEIIEELSEDGDFIVDVADFEGRNLVVRYQRSSLSAEELRSLVSAARRNDGEYHRFLRTEQGVGVRSGQSDSQSGAQSESQDRQGSRNTRERRSRERENRAPIESLVYVRISGGSAVIASAVISPVYATTTTLRYQLYFISGIMFVLAAVLAIIISKRISKPIEDINHSAMDLAKGDHSTRFDGEGFSEIVGLSDTLNATAAELGRAEALRRELLANVSHDLRTPISLIYSYAEMMHDFPEDISAQQTEVIMEETKRLTGLLNDVLDISKLETGMEQLSITRFNLTKNLGETIDNLRELLVNQGYSIEYVHGEDVYIEADEVKINRAFYNLLVNAVHFAGEDKKVLVKLTSDGNGITVSVTDYGDGIPEAELPFIWDRYYKSGKAHKRAITGTGLGLSIVKKIITLHGGTYGITSTPGTGSTFRFTLNAL